MKKHFFVLLALVLCQAGCSGGGAGAAGTPPVSTGSGQLPDGMVVNRFTGQPVPKGTWINACPDPQPGHDACDAIFVAQGAIAPNQLSATAFGGRAHAQSYPGAYPWIPMDLWTAYNTYLNAVYSGSGHTIFIVDAYDDPTAEADMNSYRGAFNLPQCHTTGYILGNGCFHKYNQTGAQSSYPTPDTGWAAETSLDLDMVSAMCPHCNVSLIEANSSAESDLYAAAAEAASMNPDAVSMSFGHIETSGDPYYNTTFNTSSTIFVAATGDAGYSVHYPAASPYVMAVGGTTMGRIAADGLYGEAAWSLAGGGCSIYETKPAWQSDPCPGRFVADISAVADPNTGVFVYDSYGATGGQNWQQVGGTSASTPIIAGIIGVALNAKSINNHWVYTHTSSLNIIASGSDCVGAVAYAYYCTATAGNQSGPSGWGSPYGIGAL